MFSIDIPRELCNSFDRKTGRFTGNMMTEFSHFVVEVSGPKSNIFKSGIKWSYDFRQSEKDLYTFTPIVTAPEKILNWNAYKKVLDNRHIRFLAY
ncbi:MAG: hypothetical protein PHN64_08465 [Desulfovibrionaceae bacterium]|nr:hypothetical protein [Desulfovibrionaceae bacterium]